MLIKRKSQLSGRWNELDLDVTQEQLDEYAQGIKLIQNVFPNLPAPEREFIKTGITPAEWNAEFGSNDQVEEPDEHDYLGDDLSSF